MSVRVQNDEQVK